tara:strand:- start:6 stop:410 length:405 start_codon:yes stop_codon:yes gene_type:complete
MKYKFYKKFSIILFLVFFSTGLFSSELNLLCLKDDIPSKTKDFKDLIVRINTDSKNIVLGGFNFTADEMLVSETNIRWKAEELNNMYEDSKGSTEGILGRFSGNLTLKFIKNHPVGESEINLNCSKFKIKNRKF